MPNFVLNAKGSEDYALFPEIKHHLRNFPGAPVRLQEGDQRWGFIHIEFRHKEML